MTQQDYTDHPITPPPKELVQKWLGNHFGISVTGEVSEVELALVTQAARWGAEQELEACAKEVSYWSSRNLAERLRDCRRPKPSSLKEQALAWCNDYIDPDGVIRRALEQLDD